MKTGIGIMIVWAVVIILGLVGEIRCIVKAVNCNWDPVGKAEIIYTAGACTGAGAIIGWIDIKDE